MTGNVECCMHVHGTVVVTYQARVVVCFALVCWCVWLVSRAFFAWRFVDMQHTIDPTGSSIK